MDIYDYMKCDMCGKTYFGHFKSDFNGVVHCIDCESPEKLTERLLFEQTYQDEYERFLVLYMLEKDLNELYPMFSSNNSLPLMQFINDSGELKLEKVYFQGNDLSFCWDVQQAAYKCVRYLDTNRKKYMEMAKNLIKTYLEMRERKLSLEETESLKQLLKSDNYTIMIREVTGYV